MTQTIFLAESTLFGLFLWLGFYILTRDFPLHKSETYKWQRPAVFCGMGTLLFAGFILGVAMQTVSVTAGEYILWQRLTWWTVPVGCTFYVGSVILLFSHLQTDCYQPLLQNRLYRLLMVVALLIAIATTTNLFIRYEQIAPSDTPFEAFHIAFRFPHYYFYALFVGGLLIGSAILLIKGMKESQKKSAESYSKWRWLGFGGGIIMVGGIVSILGYAILNQLLPQQVGDLIITVGAAMVGYGVAKYNALDHNLVIERDFEYSLIRVVVANVIYNLIFVTIQARNSGSQLRKTTTYSGV